MAGITVAPDQIAGTEAEWREKALRTMKWIAAAGAEQQAETARLRTCVEEQQREIAQQQREIARLTEFADTTHLTLTFLVNYVWPIAPSTSESPEYYKDYVARLERADAPTVTAAAPVQEEDRLLCTSKEIGDWLASLN